MGPRAEYNRKWAQAHRPAIAASRARRLARLTSEFDSGVRLRKTEKRCTRCSTTKPADAFWISNHNPDGLHGWCKQCGREHVVALGRKKMFGMDRDDFDALLAEQGGACAICGTERAQQKRDFSVDHDHKTGRVRGILCTRCNLLLGKVNDDKTVLQQAIRYLEKATI